MGADDMTGDGPIGLSLEQSDYLALNRRGHGAIPVCTSLSAGVDAELLAAAASTVAARHEPLRMELSDAPDAEPVQHFADPALVRVPVIEAPLADDADLGDVLATDVTALDLHREAPVRLHLRRGSRETFVLALIDHLATDGWGSFLFFWEFWRSYRELSGGEPARLPPLTTAYRDHIRAQQRVPAGRRTLITEYWRELAPRYAATDNGLTAGSGARPGAGRADVSAPLTPAAVRAMTATADKADVAANTVPLALLAIAARGQSNADDIALSFIYSGRERPDERGLVGVFHRRIPIVVTISPNHDIVEVVRRVQVAVVDGVRRSRPPYSLRLFRELGGSPAATPVSLLFNQVDAAVGARRRGSVQQLGDGQATFVDSHFWPQRWADYEEPALRVVLSGGEQPRLQAVFNEGWVAEGEARSLIATCAALMAGEVAADERVRDALARARSATV